MSMGTVGSETELLIDEFLPEWEFREQHSRRIDAPADQVRQALLGLTLRDLPFSGFMLGLRHLPSYLAARKRPGRLDLPLIERFVGFGFVELANTEHELVLGVAGQFWRVREDMVLLSSAEAFVRFDEPGFAKGAINFCITDDGDSVLLSTETRVHATDEQARRSFRPYWVPVRAIGGLMRSEMLWAVARRTRRALPH